MPDGRQINLKPVCIPGFGVNPVILSLSFCVFCHDMTDSRRRILIVDDDADTLTNLSDILTDVGYETETACDGQSALEKVGIRCRQDRCRYAVCLLDFKMPGMDGVQLVQELHASFPELPAIMITAFAGDDGVRRALAAGTWKVLRKPVDISDLLLSIDEAVAN